ncbi:MAG: energy transducer TonB [Bacteroidota bacterium]|nr:energy transducer TonB [Bacteroidota bacterium]
MRFLIVFLCLLNFSGKGNILAQNSSPEQKVVREACASHDTVVQYTVENAALFQEGNIEKFRAYVMKHIHYPFDAMNSLTSGKVVVRFVVDWDGKVKEVFILKSSGILSFDKEVVRVVKQSPRWMPANNSGVCVPQLFVLPVEFRHLGIFDKR